MSEKLDHKRPDLKEKYSGAHSLDEPSSFDEHFEDSPIEEVRASVPPTDDTSLPTATFRAWFWGIIFSCAISFTNQVISNPVELVLKNAQSRQFLTSFFLSYFLYLLVLLVPGKSFDHQSHCGATFGFPCWQAL